MITGVHTMFYSFLSDIVDHGDGLVTHFRMPGGVTAQLYQPSSAKQRR